MIWFGLWSFSTAIPAPGPAINPVMVQPLSQGARLGVGAEVLLLRGEEPLVATGQMGAPQLALQLGREHVDGRLQIARLPVGVAVDAAAAWHRAPQATGGTDLAVGAGVAAIQGSSPLSEGQSGIAPYAELRGAHHLQAGFSLPFSARAGVAQAVDFPSSTPFAELSVGAAWQSDSCWEVGIGVVGSTTVEAGDLRAQAGLSCRLDELDR